MEEYVLIVDDDPDTQTILTKLLGFMNWQTQVASGGEEALVCVSEHPPVLIMLDIMMPGMNGIETLGALKRNSTTRDIPVVIISALGSDQRLKRLGATHVLPKGDFTLPEITRVVNQALGKPVQPTH
jgi:CheY-like chemotaxis protein